MARAHRIPILILLMVAGASLPAVAARPPRVIYVESGSAPKALSQERIESCVHLLSREMGIDERSLPTILVIHLSARQAEQAGLKSVSVKLRVNYDAEKNNEPYYELWLVGEPTTFEYTYGLSVVLDRHFGLHGGEEQQKSIATRVARYLDATVSAKNAETVARNR